jgi:hypothetical protein
MLLATDLAVLDHHDGTVLLIANAVNYDATDERVDEAWADAVARLDVDAGRLTRPTPASAATYDAVAARGGRRAPSGLPRRGRDGQGGIRAGRRLPDRALPALLGSVPGVRAGRLPRPARDQPEPLHVPVPGPVRRARCRDPDEVAFDVVGSSPGGARQGGRRPGDAAPDRRVAAARGDARGGRRAGRGAARRPEGARRAPHARRPRAQRPRPRVRAGHGRGRRLHVGRALQPHHAHRVDRDRGAAPGPHGLRRAGGDLPRRARCPVPPSRARWRSSTSSSRSVAASTPAPSATSTSRGTSTPRSRSAPP